jgi:hypothetical protein
VLAAALLLGAPAVGIAWADDDSTGGAGGTGEGTAPTGTVGETPKTDTGSGDSSSGGGTRPTSTVGNGRTGQPEDESIKTGGVDSLKPLNTGDGKPKSKVNGFVIPVPRIPTYEEFSKPGILPPSAFIGTFEVPSLNEILRSMAQPSPEPEPPGPNLRTRQQEDAPPVVEAGGNSHGGGSDGVAAEPPVFQAPVVVVAPAPPGAPRPAPRAVPAPAPKISPAVQPAAAGVRAPLIRGTLPPEKVTPPNTLSPLSANSAQTGYPRYLRNPTVGELAAIALPGVAGLLCITFSGGVIGYRQANSTRFVRSDAARFLQ